MRLAPCFRDPEDTVKAGASAVYQTKALRPRL